MYLKGTFLCPLCVKPLKTTKYPFLWAFSGVIFGLTMSKLINHYSFIYNYNKFHGYLALMGFALIIMVIEKEFRGKGVAYSNEKVT